MPCSQPLPSKSTAKTETVIPLAACPGAQPVSTFTSDAALLSGTSQNESTEDSTGGLLRLLEPRGIMIIKDVTSILSLGPVARAQIFAALREIYDGKWTRYSGADGGRTLEWMGRIAVVGAVTTAWDKHYAAISQMGDRFVLLRLDSTKNRVATGLRAIENTGHEQEMRAQLSTMCAALIAKVDPNGVPTLSPDENLQLVQAADLVTQARTAVEFDRYRNEVIEPDDLEGSPRFAKQLGQIVRGAKAIGLNDSDAMRLAIRCARDSVPPLRLRILEDIATNGPSTIAQVTRRLNKPRSSVKRQLESLYALEVLNLDPSKTRGISGAESPYCLVEGINAAVLALPGRSAGVTSNVGECAQGEGNQQSNKGGKGY
jgi:hypothetical protein